MAQSKFKNDVFVWKEESCLKAIEGDGTFDLSWILRNNLNHAVLEPIPLKHGFKCGE